MMIMTIVAAQCDNCIDDNYNDNDNDDNVGAQCDKQVSPMPDIPHCLWPCFHSEKQKLQQ